MRNVHIAVVVLTLLVILIFTLQNFESVTVGFLNAALTVPLSILVLLIFVLGVATGGSVLSVVRTVVHGVTQKSSKEK